ncbi:myristoyl transferase [Nonlabens spongiae]|uniref:Thiamine pyrimidine synthase n=1 Tax=Nonlabens spongiae TaxID=331648 RepID=A0A1W6MP19_9FLAO|nr:ABC transporter substrate-binding protein [Nonlabens spongiae]ARN79350.1 myristoyl transferase [Nonlabens spongiae]
MQTLKIALDWTFNTNHLAFIIAQEQGFYKGEQIEIEFITPDQDNYKITPAKKVENGQAHIALCPLESVLSYQTKANPFPLIAIAAVFNKDLSAIACKKGIAKSPRELDGKSYASYNARYEDAILRQMIKNDGGHGTVRIIFPDKLGIWDTIVNGTADSTWIFTNWEALEAEENGEELELFKMSEYGIPYSYSPVVSANQTHVLENKQLYKDFLKATAQGAAFAKAKPEQSAHILKKYVPNDCKIDLLKSIKLTNEVVPESSDWGKMEIDNVNRFLNWLYEHGLSTSDIETSLLFTNEFLS